MAAAEDQALSGATGYDLSSLSADAFGGEPSGASAEYGAADSSITPGDAGPGALEGDAAQPDASSSPYHYLTELSSKALKSRAGAYAQLGKAVQAGEERAVSTVTPELLAAMLAEKSQLALDAGLLACAACAAQLPSVQPAVSFASLRASLLKRGFASNKPAVQEAAVQVLHGAMPASAAADTAQALVDAVKDARARRAQRPACMALEAMASAGAVNAGLAAELWSILPSLMQGGDKQLAAAASSCGVALAKAQPASAQAAKEKWGDKLPDEVLAACAGSAAPAGSAAAAGPALAQQVEAAPSAQFSHVPSQLVPFPSLPDELADDTAIGPALSGAKLAAALKEKKWSDRHAAFQTALAACNAAPGPCSAPAPVLQDTVSAIKLGLSDAHQKVVIAAAELWGGLNARGPSAWARALAPALQRVADLLGSSKTAITTAAQRSLCAAMAGALGWDAVLAVCSSVLSTSPAKSACTAALHVLCAVVGTPGAIQDVQFTASKVAGALGVAEPALRHADAGVRAAAEQAIAAVVWRVHGDDVAGSEHVEVAPVLERAGSGAAQRILCYAGLAEPASLAAAVASSLSEPSPTTEPDKTAVPAAGGVSAVAPAPAKAEQATAVAKPMKRASSAAPAGTRAAAMDQLFDDLPDAAALPAERTTLREQLGLNGQLDAPEWKASAWQDKVAAIQGLQEALQPGAVPAAAHDQAVLEVLSVLADTTLGFKQLSNFTLAAAVVQCVTASLLAGEGPLGPAVVAALAATPLLDRLKEKPARGGADALALVQAAARSSKPDVVLQALLQRLQQPKLVPLLQVGLVQAVGQLLQGFGPHVVASPRRKEALAALASAQLLGSTNRAVRDASVQALAGGFAAMGSKAVAQLKLAVQQQQPESSRVRDAVVSSAETAMNEAALSESDVKARVEAYCSNGAADEAGSTWTRVCPALHPAAQQAAAVLYKVAAAGGAAAVPAGSDAAAGAARGAASAASGPLDDDDVSSLAACLPRSTVADLQNMAGPASDDDTRKAWQIRSEALAAVASALQGVAERGERLAADAAADAIARAVAERASDAHANVKGQSFPVLAKLVQACPSLGLSLPAQVWGSIAESLVDKRHGTAAAQCLVAAVTAPGNDADGVVHMPSLHHVLKAALRASARQPALRGAIAQWLSTVLIEVRVPQAGALQLVQHLCKLCVACLGDAAPDTRSAGTACARQLARLGLGQALQAALSELKEGPRRAAQSTLSAAQVELGDEPAGAASVATSHSDDRSTSVNIARHRKPISRSKSVREYGSLKASGRLHSRQASLQPITHTGASSMSAPEAPEPVLLPLDADARVNRLRLLSGRPPAVPEGQRSIASLASTLRSARAFSSRVVDALSNRTDQAHVYHEQAVQEVTQAIEQQPAWLAQGLDLALRLAAVFMVSSKSSLCSAAQLLLQRVLASVGSLDIALTEGDVALVLPTLLQVCGAPREAIRKEYTRLCHALCDVLVTATPVKALADAEHARGRPRRVNGPDAATLLSVFVHAAATVETTANKRSVADVLSLCSHVLASGAAMFAAQEAQWSAAVWYLLPAELWRSTGRALASGDADVRAGAGRVVDSLLDSLGYSSATERRLLQRLGGDALSPLATGMLTKKFAAGQKAAAAEAQAAQARPLPVPELPSGAATAPAAPRLPAAVQQPAAAAAAAPGTTTPTRASALRLPAAAVDDLEADLRAALASPGPAKRFEAALAMTAHVPLACDDAAGDAQAERSRAAERRKRRESNIISASEIVSSLAPSSNAAAPAASATSSSTAVAAGLAPHSAGDAQFQAVAIACKPGTDPAFVELLQALYSAQAALQSGIVTALAWRASAGGEAQVLPGSMGAVDPAHPGVVAGKRALAGLAAPIKTLKSGDEASHSLVLPLRENLHVVLRALCGLMTAAFGGATRWTDAAGFHAPGHCMVELASPAIAVLTEVFGVKELAQRASQAELLALVIETMQRCVDTTLQADLRKEVGKLVMRMTYRANQAHVLAALLQALARAAHQHTGDAVREGMSVLPPATVRNMTQLMARSSKQLEDTLVKSSAAALADNEMLALMLAAHAFFEAQGVTVSDTPTPGTALHATLDMLRSLCSALPRQVQACLRDAQQAPDGIPRSAVVAVYVSQFIRSAGTAPEAAPAISPAGFAAGTSESGSTPALSQLTPTTPQGESMASPKSTRSISPGPGAAGDTGFTLPTPPKPDSERSSALASVSEIMRQYDAALLIASTVADYSAADIAAAAKRLVTLEVQHPDLASEFKARQSAVSGSDTQRHLLKSRCMVARNQLVKAAQQAEPQQPLQQPQSTPAATAAAAREAPAMVPAATSAASTDIQALQARLARLRERRIGKS